MKRISLINKLALCVLPVIFCQSILHAENNPVGSLGLSNPVKAYEACSDIVNVGEVVPSAQTLNYFFDSCFTELGRSRYAAELILGASMLIAFSKVDDASASNEIEVVLEEHVYSTVEPPQKVDIHKWAIEADLGAFMEALLLKSNRGKADEIISKEVSISGETATFLITSRRHNFESYFKEYKYVLSDSKWLIDNWEEKTSKAPDQ